jgi:hypothetical protein
MSDEIKAEELDFIIAKKLVTHVLKLGGNKLPKISNFETESFLVKVKK